MPYTASIDRRNPGCFLFLVDQSASMDKALAGQPGQRKMDAAADAVNRVLDNLSQRCSQGIEIRDYFDIGILGYGHKVETGYDETQDYFFLDENEVQYLADKRDNSWKTGPFYDEVIISAFPGTTPEWPFLPVSQVVEAAEVEDRQVRESDGAGGAVEVTRKVPVWLRPHAGWRTPMCEALTYAAQSVEQWIARHPDSFPPIVINISDGEATDGDPEPLAKSLMNLRTNDGNALMFNCHLSENSARPVQYPGNEMSLQDKFARQMFRISSVMPPGSRDQATLLGIPVSENSRCYVFNADMVSLVQFLDIGTRGPTNLH